MDTLAADNRLRRWQAAALSVNRTRALDLLSVCAISICALAFGARALLHSYDDAFITYRYAYNLATGHGFVYNLGEPYLGTTAPFFGVLLGVLSIPHPDAIPLLGGLLSLFSLLLTGIALYAYARLHGKPLQGLLAGLFFVTDPYLQTIFGGEMLFGTALLAWAFVTVQLRKPALTGLLLALAVLTRPDALIAVWVLGLYIVRVQRRFPQRELMVLAALVLPCLLLGQRYYGVLIPSTIDSKLAQTQSGFFPPFGHTVVPWIQDAMLKNWGLLRDTPVQNAAACSVLLSLELVMALRYRFWLLPLAYIGLYLFAYAMLTIPFYHWYGVPLSFGLSILMALGAVGLFEAAREAYRWVAPRYGPRLGKEYGPALVRAGYVLCLLFLGYGVGGHVWERADTPAPLETPKQRIYLKAARWLAANTPPDAKVGYLEIGWLGYYSHRYIVDGLGLVNADADVHVAHRNVLWTLRYLKPDYILYNKDCAWLIGVLPEKAWFKASYRKVTEMTEMAEPNPPPLEIYQRLPEPSVGAPAPVAPGAEGRSGISPDRPKPVRRPMLPAT